MDTFTCGNCQLLFTDIELFMTHKKSDCSSENATNASLPPVLPETTSDIAPAADSIITPLPIVTVPPLVQPQVDTSQPVTDAIIFVCKHCNLFSTVKEELIEHVKDEHQVIEDDVDSSISSLQPLPGSMPPPTAKLRPAVQKIVTVPFGRRRGRPRKVPKTEEQLKEEARLKNEAQERAAEAKKKEEEMMQQGDGFACSTCKRKFTRLRQMKSHRCVVDVFDDEPPTKRMRGRSGLGSSDGYENSDDTSCTQLNLSVSSGATQPSLTVFDGSNQAGMDVPQEYPDGNSLEENAEDEKKDKRSRMSYLEKYVVGEITEHCIQQTINQGAAIPHRSNTTNPVLRVFTCPHCNKLFKYRHALAVHILIHKDIKPFKCNRCNYASNSSGNLNVHMRKHTGEKFRCSKCDFTCINKGHLKVHMAKHGTDRYECELCGKKVHHPTELVKHIKYKHDIDRDNKAKEYFERKKMESRSGRRALLYQCNICERKFKTKRDHDMHLYLHTNEKPYKCELCEYSTARKPYMKVHVKKHRIVYKCCFCNESFISSHRLSVHLQESHGDLQDFDINDVYNKSVNCSLYLVEPGGKNITADEASALAILQQENIDTSQDNLDFTAMFSKGSISNIQTELEEKNDIIEKRDEESLAGAMLNQLNYQALNLEILAKLHEIYGTLECEECGKLFLSKLEYDKHKVIHTGEKSHKCQLCEYATHHADGLRRHMESVHSGIKYKCGECGLETASKYYLKQHLKKHSGPKEFKCSSCDYVNTNEVEMKSHISDLHPEMTSVELELILGRKARIQGKLGRRPYKCPYCSKLFVRGNSDLKRHIWAHKGISPFKCQICGHGTRTRSNLKAHMIKHSDAKNHLCDECGKSFKTKNSLQVHQMGHKNEKNYKCDYCDYTAIQPAHLKRHLETHGGLKPFKCTVCNNYTCNNKGTLRSHYSKKHPGEPFKEDQIPEYIDMGDNVRDSSVECHNCTHCQYVFGNKWDLRAHLKKKHKIDPSGSAVLNAAMQQVVPIDIISAVGHSSTVQDEVAGSTLQNVDQGLQYTDPSQIQIQSTDRNAVNILQQLMGMQDLAAVATAVADGTVTSDAPTFTTASETQTALVSTSEGQTYVSTPEGQTYVAITPDAQGFVAVAPNSVVVQPTPDAVTEQVVEETSTEDNKNSYVLLVTQTQDD